MSHFAVLVITDEEPTQQLLSDILMPWHEFECTGLDNRYVVDVDKTDEARETYAGETRTMLRAPDGALLDRYDDRFYRDPTEDEEKTIGPFGGSGSGGGISWHAKDWEDGRGYRSRVRFTPQDHVEVKVPESEIRSFADWASDHYGVDIITDADGPRPKHGHVLVDAAGEVVAVVDRTNPDAKWDWWTIGGRYSGRLAAGYDPEKDPANFERCFLCHGSGRREDDIGRNARATNPDYTCNGCNGTGSALKFESKWVDVGNQASMQSLDLAALKADQVARRRETVEEIRTEMGAASFAELETAREARSAAHEQWLTLPEPRPRGSDYFQWMLTQPSGTAARAYALADRWDYIAARPGQSIADWIEAAPPISAWAVVRDGVWTEKGEMGWFGMSSNDKDEDAWQSAVSATVAALPPTAWLTFVDCHI